MKLDKKFYGHLFKAKDTLHVPADEYVVFLAQDDAFAAILPDYLNKCVELGADAEHVAGVTRLINDVLQWRAAHPKRCKVPDAKDERMLQ